MMEVRKSGIQQIFPLLIVVCFISFPVYAKYSGGTGEPNDPYQIATAEDLILLGDNPDDYGKHFIMTADIDLDPNLPGGKVFDKGVISVFNGIFDGNGHIISNLTIEGLSYLGLFGDFLGRSEVMNLGVVDVKIIGTEGYVGGLAGHNRGSITNCYSTGMVTGSDYVGGLVGLNFVGRITASYGSGTFTGDWCVGGLVGNNWGSITTSYSTGGVRGGGRCWWIGGGKQRPHRQKLQYKFCHWMDVCGWFGWT